MDLRQLRYFIVVAEEGHITRAAERLGIQQPPLSRLVKAIEQEVNGQLFRRKPRGVELTDAGRVFLEKARAAIANVEQAIVAARRTARGEQGQIRVGVTPTSTFHPFVPPVIRSFRAAFPLVSLALEEADSGQLLQYLSNEQIDVAFIRLPPANPEGIIMHQLLEEELVLALPTGHPLAPRKQDRDAVLPLKAFAGESFLGQRAGLGLHTSTIAACHAAGFSAKIGQEAPSTSGTRLGYVAAGLGISLVPISMRETQIHGLSYRRIAGPLQPKLPLNLASRRNDPSAVVRQFRTLVIRAVKKYSAE